MSVSFSWRDSVEFRISTYIRNIMRIKAQFGGICEVNCRYTIYRQSKDNNNFSESKSYSSITLLSFPESIQIIEYWMNFRQIKVSPSFFLIRKYPRFCLPIWVVFGILTFEYIELVHRTFWWRFIFINFT